MDLGSWVQDVIRVVPAAPLAAFLVGLLASIGPCPLTTNIAAITYTARQFSDWRWVLMTGGLYTAGRAAGYGTVGLLVWTAGTRLSRLSGSLQDLADMALGPLLVVVGLVLLDIIRFDASSLTARWLPRQEQVASWRGAGAFVLGFLFALAFCPYSAAIFFGVLIPMTFGAWEGPLLTVPFGLGTGVPVLVLALPLALGMERAATALNRLREAEQAVRSLAAWSFIALGLLRLGQLLATRVLS